MSHFTVMVIWDNSEEQLAPFDEWLEVPKEISKEELIQESKDEINGYKNGTYAEYLKDKKAYSEGCKQEHLDYLEKEFPLKLKWTDEEHYKNAIRYYEEPQINEDGSVTDNYNPDSKWDWYQLWGRWAGTLKLKDWIDRNKYPNLNFSWWWEEEDKKKLLGEKRVDQALLKDIDFDWMKKDAKIKAKERYKKFIAELDGEEFPPLWRDFRENFKNMDEAREEYNKIPWVKKLNSYWDFEEFLKDEKQYIKDAWNNCFSTFAVLKDWKWYERGNMWWWAMVKDEKDEKVWDKEFNKLVKDLPEDTLISIYDCHI